MSTLRAPVTKNDHQTGNLHAAVTIVEYGDYQCPHCGLAHPLIKRLLQEHGDSIRFVFRNFPIQESHPAALISAQAAEAAAAQNKFWEMHDKIYEHQSRLSNAFLTKAASDLNLDKARFVADSESAAVADRIEDDFQSGIVSGVNGTPSFFVNGTRLNSYDETYESLVEAIGIKK